MKMQYGSSATGALKEALKGITAPKLLVMTSTAALFDTHVKELEAAFPGVPSIGCIAMGYDKKVNEKGVSITAFTEKISVRAGVLEQVSKKPARYIDRLKEDISQVKPGRGNTAIIDFCSGNDAGVMNTISLLIDQYGIELMGATGDGGKVSANGKVYEDGMAYAIIKNESGKVKAYKENIYVPREGVRLLASKTDKSRYYIGELNGRSAKQVYMELTGASEKGIESQTFKNPLGKMVGGDICIVSVKGVEGSGITCFRQVNDSDILTILEMREPKEVAQDTIDRIRNDFTRISGIYSVNCLFRYLLFTERKELEPYLGKIASLGASCGLIGYGEHFNGQFVNQTMTCMVFE